jgi:hypothetical protein
MRDQMNQTKVSKAFAYASRTATANGEIIDTKGFDALTFVVQLATVATADSSNYFTFTLEAGDDSGLTDGATVTAATGLLGSNLVINDATAQSNYIGMMGYGGGKRYVRLVLTETGTASAAFSAVAVQGLPGVAPTDDHTFAA